MRLHIRPISIEKIERRKCGRPVYNLAVEEDESFVADDVVVHNCRSILIPITQADQWNGKEKVPSARIKPQEGFG